MLQNMDTSFLEGDSQHTEASWNDTFAKAKDVFAVNPTTFT